jgi:hypothetical protein
MPTRSAKITQAEFDALAALANANLLPLVNASIAASTWPGHHYDRYDDPPTNSVLTNPQPDYDFSGSSSNWLSELNRIRGDYWNLIFTSGLGADGIHLSSDNLVSGPWVVGVNDLDTYPATGLNGDVGQGGLDPTQQGILFGGLNGVFCAYRNVSFLYAFDDAPDGLTITGTLSDESIFSNSSEPYPVVGLHPNSQIMRIDCIGDTTDPTAKWTLSSPLTKGVWVANTLPVPAVNVFLDQDMPPYVGAKVSSYHASETIAVAKDLYYFDPSFLDNPPTGQRDDSLPRFDSSMRMQAPIKNGEKIYLLMGVPGYPDGYPIDQGPKYNLISQSEQCQPAQWLVRRDTDFVPFDLGFNTDDEVNTFPNELAPKDGSLIYSVFPILTSVPAAIKLRLVKAGTAVKGWKNGVLQYGEPLDTNLKIFVSTIGHPTYPNPTNPNSYDFTTINNEVNIPMDGGPGYLAKILATEAFSGFMFAVQNLSGEDVAFDLVTEVDYNTNPHRQYFPNSSECFSYAAFQYQFWFIAGDNFEEAPANQPIPQNGYCIFKIRATRLPVQNSAGISVTPEGGDEIKIMVGQNRLQYDGTLSFAPFIQLDPGPGAGDTGTGAGDDSTGAGGSGTPYIITIPANARDSGDVEVFWPVLAGNELVYQCSDQIILEAWANWQPKFFAYCYNLLFAVGAFEGVAYQLAMPTAYNYCLKFTNLFDPSYANYSPPETYPYVGQPVQFPMSVEIYDDLEACLNLI